MQIHSLLPSSHTVLTVAISVREQVRRLPDMFVMLLLSERVGDEFCVSAFSSQFFAVASHHVDHLFFLSDDTLHLSQIIIDVFDFLLIVVTVGLPGLLTDDALLLYQFGLFSHQLVMLVLAFLEIVSEIVHGLELTAVESELVLAVVE